jgi:hypothetical protein
LKTKKYFFLHSWIQLPSSKNIWTVHPFPPSFWNKALHVHKSNKLKAKYKDNEYFIYRFFFFFEHRLTMTYDKLHRERERALVLEEEYLEQKEDTQRMAETMEILVDHRETLVTSLHQKKRKTIQLQKEVGI